MLAAGAAAHGGWRVVYLGADAPAVEIATAARRHEADLVGLSVIATGNATSAAAEIRILREALPSRTALLVGGAGVTALGDLPPGVTPVRDLAHWRAVLRAQAPGP